ncbi:MAG: hypothetical protein JWL81_2996 [Verrucomicrobiales bacterium]|nr:hypothetical protein [Verrucomicrobiales bacterium]
MLNRIHKALLLLPLLLPTAPLWAGQTEEWWSLRPLPAAVAMDGGAVDFYIDAARRSQGLPESPAADRRTLLRRLSFDLIGLPPCPEEVEKFVSDPDPAAYQKTVDRLLASPQYGERWARHWLDAVHYGDSHGYDKDQPRTNAWPYRDYVIRSLNEDKPWSRFVQEQLAGDVMFPGTRDGIEALGFLSAGPWDLIGHAEVSEEKTDGKIARHLDRDDMVSNTINTFCSTTVHCAQCHDHKFDPIPKEDYYALQAVFSAIDRTDRAYDMDPAVAEKRQRLGRQAAAAREVRDRLLAKAVAAGGGAVEKLDLLIDNKGGDADVTVGWHSAIADREDAVKWVRIDLGKSLPLGAVVLHPCRDPFNGIGDGFGFPVRFRIEAAEDPEFVRDVQVIAPESIADFPNPGIAPVRKETAARARYVRITATRLAPRQGDWIFALAECEVLDPAGGNLAAGAVVTSFDSVDSPPRWRAGNLTDGVWPGGGDGTWKEKTDRIREARRVLIEALLAPAERQDWGKSIKDLSVLEKELAALPAPSKVYCGTVLSGSGNFKGTGGDGGRPRPVFVLARGDVTHPGPETGPGALSVLKSAGLESRFVLPAAGSEGERRAALARWITDARHPLTWRSIVNRVWLHHFGHGLVDTPGDFGRMGELPSHPELLDWLAADFRDHGGSLKRLHRQLVLSRAYQQSCAPASGGGNAAAVDPDNRFLWRMNRRKLDAETLRDSLLAVAGSLDPRMGGPAFQDFKITHPEHSPHYEYDLADLENPALHRRAVYRFLTRSKPNPWMATLDCADPSMLVDKRNQTITPLQALAMLNNELVLVASRNFAARLTKEAAAPEAQMRRAWQLAVQRGPTDAELASSVEFAGKYGLPAACRVLLNLNEFAFAD